MNTATISKTAINIAANAHALAVLGQEQYLVNKDAVRELKENFKSTVAWALKQKLGLGVKPDDMGHDLITKERLGQPLRGYDAEHDKQYEKGELATMAILLAAEDTALEPFVKGLPWPVSGYPDKRGKLDKITRLTVAGARIAGQLDIELEKAKAEKEVQHV
jgi:hypothetical protein